MKSFIAALSLVAALSVAPQFAHADGGETGASVSHTQPYWPAYTAYGTEVPNTAADGRTYDQR